MLFEPPTWPSSRIRRDLLWNAAFVASFAPIGHRADTCENRLVHTPRERRRFPDVQGDDVPFLALLGRELAPPGLHEPGFLALQGDLMNDRAIESGVGRLAAAAAERGQVSKF